MTSAVTTSALPHTSARHSGRWLIAACLGATWFIWGSTYLAIKWALVSFPPFFQMGTRFVAAALVLGAWGAWRGAAWPTPAQWRGAFVLGALLVGVGYGFTAVAETHVSSGLVVAFIAISPAIIALMNTAYGIRPKRLEVAGITLGLVGVCLLVRGHSFSASPAGFLAQSLACLGWAAGSVWSLRGLPSGAARAAAGGTSGGASRSKPPPLADGVSGWASHMLCGGLLLLAASWATGEQPVWPPDARAAWSWLYTVVAGTLIGYTAYMVLLQRVSPALASSYAFVNPVIGMVMGATLGGELISAGEWWAAAVVTAGVVLLVWAKRQPAGAGT